MNKYYLVNIYKYIYIYILFSVIEIERNLLPHGNKEW